MKKVLIAIAIFVCAVLLISFVVFFEAKEQERIAQYAKQNQKQEALVQNNEQHQANVPDGWETYKNKEWGFEVSYPDAYEAIVDSETDKYFQFSIRKTNDQEEAKNADGVCENCTFRLSITRKFIGGPPESNLFQNPDVWFGFHAGIKTEIKRITMFGGTAYEVTYESGRKFYNIFIENDGWYDRYSISPKKEDVKADNIFKTFKITR